MVIVEDLFIVTSKILMDYSGPNIKEKTTVLNIANGEDAEMIWKY